MKQLLNIFFTIAVIFSHGQQLTILWQKTFGGTMNDRGYSISNTSNGGFIIGGTTESNDGDISHNRGFSDVWLFKIDSTGLMDWEKCFGGSMDEEAHSVFETPDKGFIIFGTTNSNDSDVSGNHIDPIFHFPTNEGWLVKMDSLRNIQWQRCLGGSDHDYGKDMIITSSGKYLIAEDASSHDGDILHPLSGSDYWLALINQNGGLEWGQTFGGPSSDAPFVCLQSTDGKFLIGGDANFDFGGQHGQTADAGLVITDTLGNLIWSKSYGGTSHEAFRTILPTHENGFILGIENLSNNGDVSSFYGVSDFWIVKIDSLGTIIWEKSFGGSCYDGPYKMINSSDGGLLISGYTCSPDYMVTNWHGDDDCWIIKLDSLGNLIWEKTLGGSQDDIATSLIESNDGGIIVCGYTESSNGDITFNHGGEDVWLIKLAPPGMAILNPEYDVMDATAYYKNNILNIRCFSRKNQTLEFSLYDTKGRKIISENCSIHEGVNYKQFNCPSLNNGIYFLKIIGKQINQNIKFIAEEQ